MNKLPSLFVSHGSPMLALDTNNPAHGFLSELGKTLPEPQAILVISAHWDTAEPQITGASHLDTIHDFYGFPEALYELRYHAPGDHELARHITELLQPAARTDLVRGLDHGAWVPLRLMYPDANIPVLQLSVQTMHDTAHHTRMGEALQSLREKGVLIMGSGGATHNLREYFRPGGNYGSYEAFSTWLHDALVNNDRDALLDYRRLAPEAARNHPTEEHFMPLFVALGAGGNKIERIHHSFDRSLCMDAYRFGD